MNALLPMTAYLSSLALRFKGDRRGVTALEYGLIAALIAVVIIGTVTTLGKNISTTFSTVAAAI